MRKSKISLIYENFINISIYIKNNTNESESYFIIRKRTRPYTKINNSKNDECILLMGYTYLVKN